MASQRAFTGHVQCWDTTVEPKKVETFAKDAEPGATSIQALVCCQSERTPAVPGRISRRTLCSPAPRKILRASPVLKAFLNCFISVLQASNARGTSDCCRLIVSRDTGRNNHAEIVAHVAIWLVLKAPAPKRSTRCCQCAERWCLALKLICDACLKKPRFNYVSRTEFCVAPQRRQTALSKFTHAIFSMIVAVAVFMVPNFHAAVFLRR